MCHDGVQRAHQKDRAQQTLLPQCRRSIGCSGDMVPDEPGARRNELVCAKFAAGRPPPLVHQSCFDMLTFAAPIPSRFCRSHNLHLDGTTVVLLVDYLEHIRTFSSQDPLVHFDWSIYPVCQISLSLCANNPSEIQTLTTLAKCLPVRSHNPSRNPPTRSICRRLDLHLRQPHPRIHLRNPLQRHEPPSTKPTSLFRSNQHRRITLRPGR
jgi:hypothetical protein